MIKSSTIPAPGHGTQESVPGRSPKPVAAPRMVKQRRRRPGLIALSVALIAVGGLSGAVLYSASGQRTAVLVVPRDVPVGTKLTRTDFSEASVALDPAVKSVKASQASDLVGQRAAVDLRAGSLLTVNQVTDKSLVGPGEQLVGVSLKPSQIPATRLVPGQRILIVSTPDADAVATAEDSGLEAKPKTLAASVVAVGAPATGTGNIVVDVAVPVKDGPPLAARVATGNVAVIVDARDGS
ncbi:MULTISPECIES: SAF domain-containing protein [unclassified Streptomyces]|uniref:SAF domain-containing protein n=1 Tax=unclassified Streptomyces TaxID=2593676 RepID=UPI0035D99E8D